MTIEHQVQAIGSFGYTEAEARFLRLVALHGGYFVRRQFLYSSGCELGKRAQDFIDKLVSRKHACREVYREDRHIFRLHYKPIYAAIGEEDNRNRREHQPATIRLRLMGLDFVLEHPEHAFLATQQDRVQYFIDTRNVRPELLPSRAYCSKGSSVVRRFANPFPLFTTSGDSVAVGFTYVDDGQLTTAAFRSYLSQYHPLFQALGSVGLVFITRSQHRFETAQDVVDRFRQRFEQSASSIDLDRLLAHFPCRLMADRRETRHLDKPQLDRLGMDLAETFSGPKFAHLYELWKESGDDAVRAALASEGGIQHRPKINFAACILERDYELFGTLQAAT